MRIGAKVGKILAIFVCAILFILMLQVIWNSMRETPQWPKEGVWECDELNVTLFLDRGEGILFLGDEEFFLAITGEHNSENFCLYVHPLKNDDSCSLKLESEVFSGYFEEMKNGCLYFSDWDGKSYCFERVE